MTFRTGRHLIALAGSLVLLCVSMSPAFAARPQGNRMYKGLTSQGKPIKLRTTSDRRGLQLWSQKAITRCTGWNPYGIWFQRVVFENQRPWITAAGSIRYRKVWTDLSSTSLFPWTFDLDQTVTGRFRQGGKVVTGRIVETIRDHRPEQYAQPPADGVVDRTQVPAPGYGDPTVCALDIGFSASRR